MSSPGDDFEERLNALVTPILAARGFTGSFPDFQRQIENHRDLLAFRLDKAAGLLKIYASYLDPQDLNLSASSDGKDSLKVEDTVERIQLRGPHEVPLVGPCFLVGRGSDFNGIARTLLNCIGLQAEPWWEKKRLPP